MALKKDWKTVKTGKQGSLHKIFWSDYCAVVRRLRDKREIYLFFILTDLILLPIIGDTKDHHTWEQANQLDREGSRNISKLTYK